MHSDQPAFTSTTGGVDELEALLTAQRLSFLASSLAVDTPEMLRNGISAFRAALIPRRLPVASPLSTETLPTHGASPSQESTVLAGGDKSGPTTCMCKDGPGIDTVLQLQIQLDATQIEVLRGSNQMNELIQSMMELKTEIQAIHAALEEPKTTAFRALDASPPVIISPAPIRPPSLEDFGHRIETPRVEPSPRPSIMSRMPSTRTPSPRISSPQMPSPRILSPRILSPRIPSPCISSPQMLSPRILSPRMPSPRIPSPCISSPQMLSPRILSPRIPSPCISSPQMPSPRVLSPRMPSPQMPSPRIDLQYLTQSVANTPVITPYIAAPHLPGIPSRTVTPIVTCSPTPRFGYYCRVTGGPEMKEPISSRLPSPAIPPPQDIAIGRPTALLPSVTYPVYPALQTASHRIHPSSPYGISPCALPVQPSCDSVVLPPDSRSGTCASSTIRRKSKKGGKKKSTTAKKISEHCLAGTPGRSPTPKTPILPPTITIPPSLPIPETPPHVSSFIPEECIPKRQAWSPEPCQLVPAPLPMDRAYSARARSPSLRRARVPLPKRSGSPRSVVSYDDPRALELPTPVQQIVIALHTFATFQHDELAFERGDTLTLVEAPSVPAGWLLGRNASGKRGLFPARYVELRSP